MAQMTDWVNTVLPIGTLVLGSLVTMTGQALRDRRMASQEQRARREGFMAGNFEVHRSAMLEMQEIVKDCYLAFVEERGRRKNKGFYDYFDQNPLQGVLDSSKLIEVHVQEVMGAMHLASSDAQMKEAFDELIPDIEIYRREAEKTTKVFKESYAMVKGLYSFWNQYAEFIYKLRLCMFRSGSNSVVSSGEAFIRSIYEWNELWSSGERQDELVEQVRASHDELNRALANALAFGPYDNYGHQRK
jgi:hypothetical protein